MARGPLPVKSRLMTTGPTWYEATLAAPPARPPLAADTEADVCVVGGGYTGLSAALHLAQKGIGVRAFERHAVNLSGIHGGRQRRSEVNPSGEGGLWTGGTPGSTR